MRLHFGSDGNTRPGRARLTTRLLLAAGVFLLASLGLAGWSRANPAAAALVAGELRLRAGDAPGADAAFRRHVLLSGESVDSLLRVASICIAGQRWDAARDYLERVLDAEPAHPARLELGIVYEKLGRDQDAEGAYREAVRRRPDALTLNALGYYYAQRAERLDDAVALLHRALELRPDEGSIIDSLGWALYQRGDPAAALQQLQVAVRRVPSSGEVRLHLGAALAYRGARSEALVELGKAVMLEPDLPGAREALAAVRAGGRPPIPFPYQ